MDKIVFMLGTRLLCSSPAMPTGEMWFRERIANSILTLQEKNQDHTKSKTGNVHFLYFIYLYCKPLSEQLIFSGIFKKFWIKRLQENQF